jgi:ADP-ribose pyrophosphatase YjhB (NUDIX family)
MAAHTGTDATQIETLFAAQSGYATPKLGVRAAVFDPEGRILLVRETADEHRWSLPGGWADVNQTAAQSAEREVYEESGYRVRATRLVAAWDKAKQTGLPVPFTITTLVFLCRLEGGEPTLSLETSEIGWFGEHAIPADLSLRRTTPRQIGRMFAHWRDPRLATEFD